MMLWTFLFATLSVCTSAAQVHKRSFLATAFRAARSRGAGAPAAAPAPAPPPPPDPFPPKFPVIGQDECSLLQEAFLLDPPATCNHVVFADNVDGCTCATVLPASINPQP